MLSNILLQISPANAAEREYLESLIRADYERCHPGETLEDMKRRAPYSQDDQGRLRDWMVVAAARAAGNALAKPRKAA